MSRLPVPIALVLFIVLMGSSTFTSIAAPPNTKPADKTKTKSATKPTTKPAAKPVPAPIVYEPAPSAVLDRATWQVAELKGNTFVAGEWNSKPVISAAGKSLLLVTPAKLDVNMRIRAHFRFVTQTTSSLHLAVGLSYTGDLKEKGRTNLPVVDQAVSALLDALVEHDMFDDTLVMMFGEFGRTPTINKQAGRDHWAKPMTFVLAGGGVPQGLVYGATDKQGALVTDASHSPADFACTIYSLLGIDPHKKYQTPAGQPATLVNCGTPIKAVMG